MTAIPIIPENAPFSPEQRSWLNGFLAGVLSRGESATAATSPAAAVKSLLIAFGSQSGNAERLAKRLSKTANSRGFAARAAGLDALKPADLAAAGNVLIITSTWGEGDMPDNAISFWDDLNQNGSSPDLKSVKYGVLALGDRNYGETFCLAGRRLDERLAELGAQRITDRVDCDVDFDDPAAAWSTAALAALAGEDAPEPETPAGPEPCETGFGRKNPFPAPMVANHRLNGPGSAKDTRHIAFSIAGSGLSYEAGDALAVQPVNHPAVVDQVIADWQLNPASLVEFPSGGVGPLHEALLLYYEVRHLLGQPPAAPGDVAALLGSLRRLQPRLYSIASSPKAHPDEVQLCIGVVHYQADGIVHEGVTSTFLADRLALGETAGVYIQTTKHFRLPADRTRPVIMVGPGTGIAPFRAFLEEREATGAPGKNWLFFGDQKSETDFLYQDQIMGWVERGVLSRLDTAFSRDQPEKIYVQTRMLQAAGDLWQWLEEGAYFFVCGDAKRMAKDVDEALHEIIRTAGGLMPEAATAYVAQLKKDKRYARDVY